MCARGYKYFRLNLLENFHRIDDHFRHNPLVYMARAYVCACAQPLRQSINNIKFTRSSIRKNAWQRKCLAKVFVEFTLLCCVVLCECDAMKSMLLACQACEILFESVSVYFVRRYFSNFSYGIENHSTCIPRRSYSTLLLPSSPTPPRRHSLAHSFRSEGEKNERKTIELVCYYLLTS